MTCLAARRGGNVAGALAGRCRAVVACTAPTVDRTVIKQGRLPGSRGMARVTSGGRDNVGFRLTSGQQPVVTVTTGASHLSMVNICR
jgi:hypothetical protein